MVFPEGGVLTKLPPNMVKFKDGAFKAAISQNTPIIPITIPNNFKILPDDNKFLLFRKQLKIIFHEPIYTDHLTSDDIPYLKDKVYNIINSELKIHLAEYFK